MFFARHGGFRLQKGIYHTRIFNDFQERGYAPVIIFIKSSSELRVFFYPDTSAGSFFIRQSVFRYYFSDIQIQQIPKIDSKKSEFQIYNIKKILVSVKKFVELLVILFSNNSKKVRLQIKIHVVDRLLIDILLRIISSDRTV